MPVNNDGYGNNYGNGSNYVGNYSGGYSGSYGGNYSGSYGGGSYGYNFGNLGNNKSGGGGGGSFLQDCQDAWRYLKSIIKIDKGTIGFYIDNNGSYIGIGKIGVKDGKGFGITGKFVF